ncbi:MAG TPA: N-formylglutamate deformylase [Steroidobacteraceae bacterium]|nr:N-formylglutamate deformylase [Steroidobacteraceae bacterium]
MSEPGFTLHPGSTPLLVSVPHAGRDIPAALRGRYVPRALDVEDTDWHVDALYDFARGLGAGLIVPRCSRYVIDLNRPPDDAPLYPGAHNTELCPTHFFTGDPLYRDGCAPGAGEIARRRERYWQPYHAAVAAELSRLHARHGYALLWDGHSIRSRLPWLFEGKLPDLNLGTADGASCAPSLRQALQAVLGTQPVFTQVVDGRFKGGYITRRYGQPAQGVHAVQLEMCWSCYMPEQAPFVIDPARQAQLQPVLEQLLRAMLRWRPHG